MSQKPAQRPRRRRELSKAELKAYQARREDEMRRLGPAATSDSRTLPTTVRRTYTLGRDEEFSIIRSDLRRLLLILVCLVAVVVVMTIFLR